MLTAGYRADGQRAWKQTVAGRTYYVYDGDKLLYEMNAAGTLTAQNTWGVTGLLARATSTRTLLYTWDAQGNVSQQLDASTGSIVASYMFDAFGTRSVTSSDPTAPNEPYSGFGGSVGYYTDVETGLQLLGHRYYDPSTGRFLTRDPISYAGGVNVYEYVCNSPLGQSDSSGFEGRPSIGGSVGAGALGGLQECLATIISVGIQRGTGSTCNNSMMECQMAGGCLTDLLGSILCKIFFASLIPIAPWLAGCICGALEGLAHYIVDYECEKKLRLQQGGK